MSFCQKHINHHCIHAHQCTNKDHKAKQKENKVTRQRKQCKKISKKQESHQCKFKENRTSPEKPHQNISSLKQCEKAMELAEALQISIRKQDQLDKQNKHLYAQLLHYRQQNQVMSDTNTVDFKNQIKKRVEQTTDLNIHVKSLQSQVKFLKNNNFELLDQIEKIRCQFQCEKSHLKNYEEKYHEMVKMYKILSGKVQGHKQNEGKENKHIFDLQSRLKIVMAQNGFEIDQLKLQKQHLNEENQRLKKDINKLKSFFQKNSELLNIQIEAKNARQSSLVSKVEKYQEKILGLSQQMKDLVEKCEQLQQDLEHAKRVIEKNSHLNQQMIEIQKSTQSHHEININIDKKTILKENNLDKIPKENTNQQTQRLQSQNKELKQKIFQIENRQTANYEEVVLNMGASEAFKKLVDEKNSIIKKLMKEKGEIYRKILCSNCNN